MIFISSPYTSEDPKVMEERFEEVTRYAAQLIRLGYTAFSPITYGHTIVQYHPMPVEFEFWQKFCIGMLRLSTEVHVLKIDGWIYSKGLAAELDMAKTLGIKIVYIDNSFRIL